MAKREIIGARLQGFTESGSMGLVTDTIYRRCFWPALPEPVELFSAGSSGIEVEGPPTPRNVLFPLDTVFIGNTRGDCFFRGRLRGAGPERLDPREPDNREEISRAEAVLIQRRVADAPRTRN